MITTYHAQGHSLIADEAPRLEQALWIDLFEPNADEEHAVETLLGLDIPTRDDMQEIEWSSRLYAEGDVLYLTAQIIATPESGPAQIGPVTFVLAKGVLVTVRYHTPHSITEFVRRAGAQALGCTSGAATFVALLETVVDRIADVLEAEARRNEAIAHHIFEAHRPQGRTEKLGAILQRIGRAESLNGKLTESLGTLQRLVGYLAAVSLPALAKLDKSRLKTLQRDIRSLQETAGVQERKILFLLDATLGVTNIRQSDVIKIFSVVAFVFLPPTLIASIYGMNFDVMPELRLPWGYPAALGAMVLSVIVPYLVFRWKKWL